MRANTVSFAAKFPGETTMRAQSEVPTLINARWVVPVEPAGAVLDHHSVAVRDGEIEALLPTAQAAGQFADYASVDLPEHVLVPGFVNLHTHAAMTLMRGMADDLPLMRWLQEHIWPAEAKHVSPQFVHDGTLIACAEMLRGGITWPTTKSSSDRAGPSRSSRAARCSRITRWLCGAGA